MLLRSELRRTISTFLATAFLFCFPGTLSAPAQTIKSSIKHSKVVKTSIKVSYKLNKKALTMVVDQAARLTVQKIKCKKTVFVNGKCKKTYSKDTIKGRAVKWTTRKPSVAGITKSGRVRAKSEGKTVIFAKYKSRKMRCTIRVKSNTPESNDTINGMPINSFDVFDARVMRALLFADKTSSMISPFGFEMALGLTSMTLDDTSRDTITKALGFETADAMYQKHKEMMSSFQVSNEQTVTKLTNSFWLDNQIMKNELYPDFVQRATDIYKAYINDTQDIHTEDSKKAINNWASDATNGLIPEFLSRSLDEDIDYMSINALYFKSVWSEIYARTAEKPFYGLTKESKNNYFTGTGYYKYGKLGALDCIKIPYQNGFSMTIYRYGTGSNDTNNVSDKNGSNGTNVSNAKWDEIFSQIGACTDEQLAAAFNIKAETKVVKLCVPVFECETDKEVSPEELQKMGIPNPVLAKNVDGKIKDLSGLQSTKIKCDENGTEAAAVTAIIAKTTSALISDKPIEFTVDHPFLYSIEDATGNVLFVGKVTDLN